MSILRINSGKLLNKIDYEPGEIVSTTRGELKVILLPNPKTGRALTSVSKFSLVSSRDARLYNRDIDELDKTDDQAVDAPDVPPSSP